MITREEIVRSLTGAWEIFLDRRDAMLHFDVSVEGFWRSFQAIWLVLPTYVIVALGERWTLVEMAATEGAMPPPDAAYWSAKLAALAADWVMLPLILALAAGPLGISDRYTSFVVARNWATVLVVIPYAGIALFFGLGFFTSGVASFVSLALLILVLRYMFLVARHSLQVSVGFAIALVVFDFALSLFIGLSIDGLFGL